MSIDTLFDEFPSEEEMSDIVMHVSTAVWGNELTFQDIENWLSNFKGEILDVKYERLLALWLLTHFTYYNTNEVNHLCKTVYNQLIHNVTAGIPPEIETPELIEQTINDFFNQTNIISAEVTSGSGGYIAYIFRQVTDLPITLFNFSLENVSNTIKNIIVIDDVTLSVGEKGQMFKFWSNAQKNYPYKQFFLLTLLANRKSIEFLKTTFNIEVISAIVLDDRHKCFFPDTDTFASFPHLIEIAKKVMEHYGRKIGITDPLGYNDGQYTFGFYYNIPDNCLPIFWGQINGWVPILKRYHKNYRNKKFLHGGQFI